MNVTRECDDLDREIDSLQNQGFRLDMIMPADSPREVQLSKNDEIVRLIHNCGPASLAADTAGSNDWITGRAGMMYRDLLPDRLGGKLIASHIRLTEGGTVPDDVHYHKIDFQLIYCLKGRIRVVYEDQGEPFWLEPGDCVLQPPEIRHRVLECVAGSEVLELSSPAEHETWVEHELALPTASCDPDRRFGRQHFVRSVAKNAPWLPSETEGIVERDLGISDATDGLVDVRIRRMKAAANLIEFGPPPGMIGLNFAVGGPEEVGVISDRPNTTLNEVSVDTDIEILRLEFRDTLRIDTER
jgi:quercetin dioxygenase-like cupin family protein